MCVRRVFFGMLALAIAALGLACAGQAPAGKPAESAAPSATPAAAPAPTPAVSAQMDDHFAKVTEVHDALIRGDLEGAKEPAKWIAEHQQIAGLPASAGPSLDEMKKGARQVVESADVGAATQGAASMAVACGSCHTATNAKPKFPPPASPAVKSEARTHMLEHQHAIDLLYQGLVGPSDQAWADGAKALKAAPLAGGKMPKDPQLTRERLAAEAAVHTLADKAATAANAQARAQVYAELVGGCASCHALHGKVWGPGLPK
jgi:mono/diheme cytochrome c family protein